LWCFLLPVFIGMLRNLAAGCAVFAGCIHLHGRSLDIGSRGESRNV
jgi:hypothetical protein